MKSTAMRLIRWLGRLAVGLAVLVAILFVRRWTKPWWDPSAYRWAYTATPSPRGERRSLSIKARASTMTDITGVHFTPTLSIICQNGHVYVEMETARVMCAFGPCPHGGILDAAEYFVRHPGAHIGPAQQAPAIWYFRGHDHSRLMRFTEWADDPARAARETPQAVAFVRRLASSREFSEHVNDFETAGFGI